MPPPRRIALLKPSALGDIAHALPALAALRGHFPESHITWVVNKGFEPLLRLHPMLNATLPFDRAAFRRRPIASARSAVEFLAELRRRRFDWVIDLQGLARTGVMALATGAPFRAGFADAREGSRHAYTRRVRVPAGLHAIDRYLMLLKGLGVPTGPARFVLPVDPAEAAAARAELAPFPRPWIAVAPGAKWVTKQWPPDHFAALLRRAQAEYGGTAVVVGAAEDRPLAERMLAELSGTGVDLTGRTSLPRLAAVLSLADMMLANDTGPLHLAAALGRPCVAPYTCTVTRRHGPYGVAGGVETGVICGGSYFKQCPHGFRCFAELTPERLWPTMQGALAAWSQSCRSA